MWNSALRPKTDEIRAGIAVWSVPLASEHIAAGVNLFEHEELAALRAERMKSKYPLGDKPLIVLTRGIPDEDSKDIEEEHRRDHTAIATLSRNGNLVIASRSGRHVQLDEPELVADAIREVLAPPLKR
jgi:hypothetical protein